MGLFGLFGKKIMFQCTCGCGCREQFEKYGRRSMDYYTEQALRVYEKNWKGDYTICMDCNLDKHTKKIDSNVNAQNRRKFSSEVEQRTLKNQRYRCNDCGKVIGEVKGRLVWFDYDHIDGNPSNNDPSNCQALCKNCHQYKTERERNSKG